ncbi:MAG: helix-turn-helix domain-containing protein [Eubacteriales bacterium]|nr:helix-turn-helix domain-containing protein [Eubacteriales bacterium]
MLDKLTDFDLTRQEAAVYLLLYSNPDVTGYEIAKLAGISRSNAYAALSSLTDKGAARLLEGMPNRYSPVPADEFCGNRIRRMRKSMDIIVSNMPDVSDPLSEGYLTIQGDRNIIDTARSMLLKAEKRVYISVSGSIIGHFTEELCFLTENKRKVVIITNPPFDLSGAIIYHSNRQGNQLRLITDSRRVLTGDIDHGKESTCLLSGKRNLVDVFKEALQNEIKLIELREK